MPCPGPPRGRLDLPRPPALVVVVSIPLHQRISEPLSRVAHRTVRVHNILLFDHDLPHAGDSRVTFPPGGVRPELIDVLTEVSVHLTVAVLNQVSYLKSNADLTPLRESASCVWEPNISRV